MTLSTANLRALISLDLGTSNMKKTTIISETKDASN